MSRLAASILMLAIAGCKESTETPTATAPPPAIPVKVASVIQRDVPDMIENIGQTRGSTEVEIRARVEGFLDAVKFDEGQAVKKGDLLYEIDPKPFIATVNRTKGILASAQADLARAKQDVARYKPLVEQNAISREA
jgi:membrane fusion protein (multidrug efflux system)